jgi:hypothetical protein
MERIQGGGMRTNPRTQHTVSQVQAEASRPFQAASLVVPSSVLVVHLVAFEQAKAQRC